MAHLLSRASKLQIPISVERKLRSKFWHPDGNWTHDILYTCRMQQINAFCLPLRSVFFPSSLNSRTLLFASTFKGLPRTRISYPVLLCHFVDKRSGYEIIVLPWTHQLLGIKTDSTIFFWRLFKLKRTHKTTNVILLRNTLLWTLLLFKPVIQFTKCYKIDFFVNDKWVSLKHTNTKK